MRVLALLAASTAAAAFAQPPASAVADTVVSPEVHTDHRVTFRLYAPKAQQVTINGDWMKLGTREPMTHGENGVWTFTAGPFAPQVHLYSFQVDGMTIADPVNPRIKLRARTSASLVEITGDAPWSLKNVPHGRVEILTHHSALLGDAREVFVYTPPGYNANSGKRYPVLYLMHGNNDVAAGWMFTGRAHVILDNLIAEGKAKPMLVVMPWAHAAPFGAPNQRNLEMFDAYLVKELVPLVDSSFRTVKNSASRALAGLSMGAGQSLHAALLHPDLFGNIGLFSLGGFPRGFEERYAAALADPKALNAKLKVFWIAIGRQDEGLEGNRRFRALLSKRGIAFTESEGEGAHFYPVFRRELSEFAPMLFR